MNTLKSALFALVLGLAGISTAQAQVSVTTYGGYNETGTGFDFSGLSVIGTENWAVFDSNAKYPAFTWNQASIFSADITGNINIATAGNYGYSLTSDDGSYAFIDGVLVANDGGIHGAQTVNFNVNLAAGMHTVEIQFGNYYCCGSGVTLADANGAPVLGVPEPQDYALLLAGAGVLAGLARRRTVRASA